jgi:mannosyl-oligosaccharide alpha-1,2-mannosidase
MGMSMLDALDTMWIMGMKEEFAEAQQWLSTNIDFDLVKSSVSFFETSIRALGGLLSAYEFSGDRMFLLKAQDLADRYSMCMWVLSSLRAWHVCVHCATA